MTPQTRFSDGTQTLFIGEAVFVPYKDHHICEKLARKIIFEALEKEGLKSVEEIAQEVGFVVSKAKRALFSMISDDCEHRVYKVWRKVHRSRPRCVYTTKADLAAPEPIEIIKLMMSDGVGRSLKAVIKESGLTYKTANKHLRGLTLTGELTVADGILANGHVAAIYKVK